MRGSLLGSVLMWKAGCSSAPCIHPRSIRASKVLHSWHRRRWRVRYQRAGHGVQERDAKPVSVTCPRFMYRPPRASVTLRPVGVTPKTERPTAPSKFSTFSRKNQPSEPIPVVEASLVVPAGGSAGTRPVPPGRSPRTSSGDDDADAVSPSGAWTVVADVPRRPGSFTIGPRLWAGRRPRPHPRRLHDRHGARPAQLCVGRYGESRQGVADGIKRLAGDGSGTARGRHPL